MVGLTIRLSSTTPYNYYTTYYWVISDHEFLFEAEARLASFGYTLNNSRSMTGPVKGITT